MIKLIEKLFKLTERLFHLPYDFIMIKWLINKQNKQNSMAKVYMQCLGFFGLTKWQTYGRRTMQIITSKDSTVCLDNLKLIKKSFNLMLIQDRYYFNPPGGGRVGNVKLSRNLLQKSSLLQQRWFSSLQ